MTDDDEVAQPTLSYCTPINKISTRNFICLFTKCDQQYQNLKHFKRHYRMHGGSGYRPIQCNISDCCKFSANRKENVFVHIRKKHNLQSENIDELNEKFVFTYNGMLKKEDALFNNAKIVGQPKTQKLERHLFECTFLNSLKNFNNITCFCSHHRTHTHIKPYFLFIWQLRTFFKL